jgi:hypothetical protein
LINKGLRAYCIVKKAVYPAFCPADLHWVPGHSAGSYTALQANIVFVHPHSWVVSRGAKIFCQKKSCGLEVFAV